MINQRMGEVTKPPSDAPAGWPGVLLLALLVFAALAVTGPVAARDYVAAVETRPGVTQGYYVIEPRGEPRAIVFLFLGGDGALALDSQGPTKLKGNFLFRVRDNLSRAGLLLALPDAPSDQSRGLGNFRTSANHAQDVKAVIQALKAKANLPVFLIGTSRGTVSVANVAARLEPSLIQGILLTSTVTERSRNKLYSVRDTALADIRVPAFVMSHRDDGCYVTPASDTPWLLRAMSNAPRKDSAILTGGKPPKSDPCEAFAQHGFFGIEDEAAKAMTDWIASVLAAR